MKVILHASLKDLPTTKGATETKKIIIKHGKEKLFEELITDMYPDGISIVELNDYLWFESEDIYKLLGIFL